MYLSVSSIINIRFILSLSNVSSTCDDKDLYSSSIVITSIVSNIFFTELREYFLPFKSLKRLKRDAKFLLLKSFGNFKSKLLK